MLVANYPGYAVDVERFEIASRSPLENLPVGPSRAVDPSKSIDAGWRRDHGRGQNAPISIDQLNRKVEHTEEWAQHVIRPQSVDNLYSKEKEASAEEVPRAEMAAGEKSLVDTLPAPTPTLGMTPDQHHTAEPPRLTASEVMRALQGDCRLIEIMARQKRLDARDAAGATVLHIAARRGHLDLYTGLIAAGAGVRAGDQEGKRADELLAPRDAAMVADRAPSTMAWSEAHAEPEQSPVQKGRSFVLPGAPEAPFELVLGGPDDDIVFEVQESAAEFNRQAGLAEARADFWRVGIVERIDGEDGGEFSLTDDPAYSRISGDDLVDFSTSLSDGDLERTRSSTFLSVSRGRRGLPARAATTEGYHLPVSSCRAWLKDTMDAGVCSESDVDDLVGLCRGDFSARDVRANLARALEVAGVVTVPDDSVDDIVSAWHFSSLKADELAEALSAAATRTNRVPGDEAIQLTRRREQALFRELNDARQLLVRSLMESPEARAVAQRILAESTLPAADEGGAKAARADMDEASEPIPTGAGLVGFGVLSEDKFELSQLDAIVDQLGETALSAQSRQAHRRLRRAFDQLLVLHLPLARRFAVRRTPYGEDVEDFFQDCVPALQRAIWKFDPELGYRLQTYATFWMRQILTRSQQNVGSLVRVPVHRHELLGRLDLLDAERDRLALPMLSTAEAASLLEVDERFVDQLRAIPRVAQQFDENYLDDHAPDAIESVHARQRSQQLDALMDDLDERQKDIIRRRFGFDGNATETLEEIGDDYGVTRERIRQIEAKALRRLGHPARLGALRELL